MTPMKPLQINLPEDTLKQIDQAISRDYSLTDQNQKISHFIDQAVKFYISEQEKLKERIKEGAIKNQQRDQVLADEWFNLEEEIL